VRESLFACSRGVPLKSARRLASATTESATAPAVTGQAPDWTWPAPKLEKSSQNFPQLATTSTAAQGSAGGHHARQPMGPHDVVGCTTNSSLHPAEMQPSANGMAPTTAPYISSFFWESPGPRGCKRRHSYPVWPPNGPISIVNTSLPLTDIWLDLLRKAGSIALDQIICCMLTQVKPQIRLSRCPIPKNIPPIMHGALESGFPPDVIQTNDTRLRRRGFTSVLLYSNTPVGKRKQTRALL
jgi:hypothetical protein